MTAAKHYELETPGLLSGRVVLCEGQSFSVALESGDEVIARRAASCMLTPCSRDRVLVSFTPEPYILAVLDRNAEQTAEVNLPGDIRISAPTGRLDLSAADGLNLATGKTISILSQVLSMKSARSELFAKHLELVSETARAHSKKVTLFADSFDSYVTRITERAKRVYRIVEQFDQLRAKHIDHRAESTAQLRGENTVVTAQQVVKVDAEAIHIG